MSAPTVGVEVIEGDALTTLRTLPARSVQMCVTSPPYFGLRDYGHAGQMGLEATPDEYVRSMVEVFAEVRRVLKDDGTLWLNIGDSYANDGKWGGASGGKHVAALHGDTSIGRGKKSTGCKAKDLIGIPWLLAFGLRADGWYLRSDIIWHKPNPMPESVTDRPTKSHEYVFLLSKSDRYLYDAAAIAEPSAHPHLAGKTQKVNYSDDSTMRNDGDRVAVRTLTRNKRTVWTVATAPYSGAHFATFPPALIEPCIKAGSRIGDTVLDPFGGAGTTGLVASRLQRNALLIELNPAYAQLARERITADAPLFAAGAA